MTQAKPSRREQILHALMDMLQSHTGGPITTAALARQVGVSEAALYRHFASKAKMYDALLEFIDDALLSRTKVIQQQELDAASQCQQMLLLVLTFVERNPGTSRLLCGEALMGEKDRLRDAVNQLFDKLETQLKQVLREAELKEGKRTIETPSATAALLMAVLEGRIRQFVRSEFKRAPTQGWAEQWGLLAPTLFRP